MDIGNSIQNNRKRLGLSQEELGQQLSVSRQTVSQWENGQTMPSIDNLLRLKEIFGITLDALCGCAVPEQELESVREQPEHVCRFTPDSKSIKELCRFTGRPNLHKYLIYLVIYLICIIITIASADESTARMWFFFLLICMVGLTLRFFWKRKLLRKPMRFMAGLTYESQFFSDYFLILNYQDDEQISWEKYYYHDIQKFNYTKHFMILQTSRSLYPLPKQDACQGSPLLDYLSKNPNKKAPGSNVVLWKTASLILFIASIATIWIALFTIMMLEERSYMFIQNMWMQFLFVPIPAASFIFGIIAKQKGYPQTKNIVIGIIIAAWLVTFGCFTFIFPVNDDPTPVHRAEEVLCIDLPDYEAISTTDTSQAIQPNTDAFKYYTCEVYFNEDGVETLETLLENDERFLHVLPSELIGISSFMYAKQVGDYVLLYNMDTRQFNALPDESRTYHFICIEYQSSQDRMSIVEYDIEYVK